MTGRYTMVDIHKAKELSAFCGIYCGTCGMYRGRVYAKIAQEFLEVIIAGDYPDELTINPKGEKPDFDFNEFLKGVEYFCREESGAYCQRPCKQAGGVACDIRICARKRGFEMCYECEDFPCEHFSLTLERHPERLEDYERFKELGFEGWLRFHAERIWF